MNIENILIELEKKRSKAIKEGDSIAEWAFLEAINLVENNR